MSTTPTHTTARVANRQRQGPAKARKIAHEQDLCVTAPCKGGEFILARVNRWASTFDDRQDEANARLLASAYTMADRDARKLGIDAVELCESLDLAALLTAAQRALALAKRGLEVTEPGSDAFIEFATLETSIRAALPEVLREPDCGARAAAGLSRNALTDAARQGQELGTCDEA